MTKAQLFQKVIEYFSEAMPNAESELNYHDAFSLLVAVVLSAQCTDKRVNTITPGLLARYPDAEAMSKATPEEIFEHIKSCSYPNSKSKHLSDMSRMLCERFGGEVPDDIELLQTLPGVGRKTANVVASVYFGKSAMPVDTHVFRVAARIGLSRNAKTPLDTEKQLTAGFPAEILGKTHHWLILHGRYTCLARKPQCDSCGIHDICQHKVTNGRLSVTNGAKTRSKKH